MEEVLVFLAQVEEKCQEADIELSVVLVKLVLGKSKRHPGFCA